MNINVIQRAFRRILYKNTRMKYLFLCIGFVFTCSAYAQVVDTTLVDQRVYIDLNLKKLDSTLQAMQSLIDLQQAEIDALEAGTGEPAGNSSTAENHGTWVWSAQESTFTVPSNVTQLVVTATGSTGGSGQHASASLSGAGAPALQVGGLVAMGHTFMLYLATSLRVIPFPWKWPPMDLMEPIVQVVNRVERAVNFRALGIREPQEKLQSSN